MAKSSLSYHDRQRIEFLTSHLRSGSRASVKEKYVQEIEQILDGKELTRSDLAYAAYYMRNSGQSQEDHQTASELIEMYRSIPAE